MLYLGSRLGFSLLVSKFWPPTIDFTALYNSLENHRIVLDKSLMANKKSIQLFVVKIA